MNSRHTKEFEIYYYDINQFCEATPVTILKYLQETAISHSTQKGYSMHKLKEQGAGWVLNRWNLKMQEYPSYGEKIIIETWPSKLERFYGHREFSIKNKKGEFLGGARSLWIFFDMIKKKPIRIYSEIIQKFEPQDDWVFYEPFEKLIGAKNYEFNKEFFTRKSDIDTNNHVNNSKYVEWALESVPYEIYNNYKLSSINFLYKKDVSCGELIYSVCEEGIVENGYKYVHSILDKDNNELAVGRTHWVKR